MNVKKLALVPACVSLLCHFLFAELPEDAVGAAPAESGADSPASSPLFTGLDFFGGLAVKDCRKEAGEGTDRDFKGDSAVVLRLQGVEGILSFAFPATDAAVLGEGFSSFFAGDSPLEDLFAGKEVKQGGISFYIKSGDAPSFFYEPHVSFGNLHFSASLSRLKRPCLSAPWNFASLSLLKQGLSVSLPGPASAKSPDAVALCLLPSIAASLLPAVELALLQGGDVYSSVHKELSVPGSRSSFLRLALNGASCVYGGKERSSWFYKEPYYREKRYLSADGELGFRIERLMSGNFAAGFSEDPFGGLDDLFFWRRGQLAFSFWKLGLTASHFLAEAPDMILPGGGRLNMKERFSLNPSLRLDTEAGVFSLALLGKKDEKLKGGEEVDSFCFGARGSWRFRRGQLSLQYTGSRDSISGLSEEAEGDPVRTCSVRLSCQWPAVRTATALSVKQDAEKFGISFSQYLYPRSCILSRISFAGTREFRGEEGDLMKLQAGLSFAIRLEHTSIQGKFLYTSTFYGDF